MLKDLIGKNEKILIKGEVSKNCFVLESIFNPMLVLSIILALFDILVFDAASKAGIKVDEFNQVIVVLLIHMIPVYIYIIGIFLTNKKFKNMECIITNKCVYISKGKIFKVFDKVLVSDIFGAKIYKGLFDSFTKSGDIVIAKKNESVNNKIFMVIEDLDNYVEVLNTINKLVGKEEKKQLPKKKATDTKKNKKK